MNAEISVFVIGHEAIIYLLLYNLHDCTFNVKSGVCLPKMLLFLLTKLDIIPSNNSDKNFIENLNYLYHGLIHSGMLQTFWTPFNVITDTTTTEMFYKKLYQTLLGLNLKAEDYQYLTKL